MHHPPQKPRSLSVHLILAFFVLSRSPSSSFFPYHAHVCTNSHPSSHVVFVYRRRAEHEILENRRAPSPTAIANSTLREGYSKEAAYKRESNNSFLLSVGLSFQRLMPSPTLFLLFFHLYLISKCTIKHSNENGFVLTCMPRTEEIIMDQQ